MTNGPQIRDYRPGDEASWLRCRALSFLGSAYFDDVHSARTTFEGDAIQLVATMPKPAHVRTPGTEQVVGILDVELWQEVDGTDRATIDTIAVHPDHQRAGIADELLARGLERLAGTGAATLDAWTREDEAATAWYVRHGFRIETEYLHVYADHDEAGGFTSPEPLSRPVKVFCHARLDDEVALRERYSRVHRCRRYVRPVRLRSWPEEPAAVATYDEENGERDDLAFFASIARRLAAQRVTDLGCGTGVLAIDLAAAGHTVTGIDPGEAILDLARTRPGAESVTWKLGEARDLPDGDADLVVMSAHVANYFLTKDDWYEVLGQVHRTLRPGGHLAFDSWNPRGQVWKRWNNVLAVHLSADGHLIETHGSQTGEDSGVQETLRHWPLEFLRTSMSRVGFEIIETWGSHRGSAASADGVQFVVLARRD